MIAATQHNFACTRARGRGLMVPLSITRGPGDADVRRLQIVSKHPYNLPIWRRYYRSVSPNGRYVAQIDPAYEVSMGNPTSGILCVLEGPHIERCNPSFIWSDDSRYLAVPQYFERFGLLRRQRLLIVSMDDHHVLASKAIAAYIQPESFLLGQLVVTVDPARSHRQVQFTVPGELSTVFERIYVPWPEAPPN